MPTERSQPARCRGPGPHQHTAQAGAAAGVDDIERAAGFARHFGQRLDDELGRAVVQRLQLGVERIGEAVEHLLHIGVARAHGGLVAQAGGQLMVDHRVVRLLGQPFAVQPGCPLAFTEQQQGADDLVARLRALRPQGDRSAVGEQPLVDLAPLHQDQRQVVPGVREVRRHGEGAPAGRFGLGRATLSAVHDAQVAERRGGFRLTRGDGDAAFVGLHRVVDTPRDEQHVAQVVPRAGVFRNLLQCRGDQVDGFVDAALRMPQHAQEVQRVGLAGPAVEDLDERSLGFVEPVVAQQLDGVPERFDQLRADWASRALPVEHSFAVPHQRLSWPWQWTPSNAWQNGCGRAGAGFS